MNRSLGFIRTVLTLVCAILVPSLVVGAPTPTGINPAVNIALPNYANSPNLRKFVDSLPGLGYANRNNLGQYIPVGVPDQNTYPGSDYYEIGLQDHLEQMNSDLPASKIRGYFQINTTDPNVSAPHYLGPLIVAQRDRPVRFKFFNQLPTGAAGNLSLPVDTTIMGAGMGPMGGMELYTQNRADLHLHGGFTPWISDGTPHQWVTPAGDPTSYKKGVSFQNVPDMINGSGIPCIGGSTCFTPTLSDGVGTYYYPNQQSARLMFYHDHSYGITRLNVYAGEAAGYLITDQVEEDLIAGTNVSGVFGTNPPAKILPDPFSAPGAPSVYRHGIPLVIQDKTFVNDATTPTNPSFAATGAVQTPKTAAVDPLWYSHVPGSTGGNFWFPHEYLPNENIYDPAGFNVMGRWDYAPWMIPPMPVLNNTLPSPTLVPEAFMDTPIVNGTAYPYLELPPTAVRFRILNACNDRMLNLQLYKAEPLTVVVVNGGSGYTAPVVTFSPSLTGVTATGTAIMANGVITGITVTNPGSGYTTAPTITITDGGAGTGAAAYATLGTEVKMVAASPNPAFPTWPSDGRPGGVPDPTTAGPTMYQIGNEAGFLAKVAVVPPQPVDFDYNRRSVTFGGVTSKALYLPPAVRADVVVDLSTYKDGDTLILYNDAPAPMPLFDTRYDYFTNNPDQTGIGGAPMTPAGFGPNTRTVMQIRIKGAATAAYDVAALQAILPKAFAVDQEAPLVPAAAFNAAYGTNYQNIFANSVAETLNVTGTPQPVAKVMVELPGFGYTTPPAVSFFGGGGTGATATATLNGVTGLTLVTAGSGCTTAPTVSFTPAPGDLGTGATATAIVSGGVVTTIAITSPGSNYLVAPTVNFAGGCPVAPTATANLTLGSVGTINLTNPGSGYTNAPRVYLTGGGGTGATAAAMLNGSLILNGKNLVEGFDMEFGRMNAVLGSTPNILAPTVGAGPIIGANFYVDPPTEIMKAGETVLWRLNHLGVDSHAIHFHLFDVQVVNRVDWTNTVKAPYDDEIGWKETIRTNPFEDIIVAIRPKAMNLPFALPDSVRLLDPTSPAGSTSMFQPVLPPPGVPAVAQITNVMTNFGWEYVWHCHLLGHEENDMMRPVVFQPGVPVAGLAPTTLAFGNQQVGIASTARTVTLSNTGLAGTQSLIINSIGFTGGSAGDFAQTTTCGKSLPPGNSCTISITFNPTTTGARTAALAITTSDPVRPALNVSLTGTGVAPPAPPTNVAGTIVSGTQIRVSWTDASNNETSFAVWRSDNNGPFVQVGTVTRTATQSTATGGAVTFNNTGLITGTIYSYYVTAVNAAGSSPASPTVVLNLSIPTAPTNLIAAIKPGVQVTLNWTVTSNNQTGFTIQRATNALFTTGLVSYTAAATATSYVDTAIVANTVYYYRVRAANIIGSSAWSNVAQPTGPAMAGVFPTALSFSNQPVNTTSPPQTVTLSNSGFSILNISSIGLGGTDSASFAQTNTCGTGIAAGTSCTISVTFTPAVGGALAASLVINSDDPLKPTIAVPLSGTDAAVLPLAMDVNVFTDRATAATTIVSPAFSTAAPNELLLAFISAPTPSATPPNTSVTGVAGGGLTWVLVQRTNTQMGTAEIWRAFAASPLAGASVTATLNQSVPTASMTVISFTGVDTTGTSGSGAIGAIGTANALTGAPSASLVTTRPNSWVFGVGNDWDGAAARTVGTGQTMVHQYLAPSYDTFWVQRQTNTTPLAGTTVTINDTAPTNHRYNLSIVEVRTP